MYRLFTLTEATRLLPLVDERLGALQGAAADVARLRDVLASTPDSTVEAANLAREIAFLLGVIHTCKAELDGLGVQVRDVETGRVDFPSQLGAEVVCLTWAKGQTAITQYHPLSDDSQTRPLPTGDDAGAHAAAVGDGG